MQEEILLLSVIVAMLYSGAECAPGNVHPDLEEEALQRSSREFEEVPGARCGYFVVQRQMSIYGWNTRKIEDLTLAECLKKCTKERTFYCRSVDFNADSATSGDKTSCYLSSENQSTIPYPDDFSRNFNTNYYERTCEEPVDEGSAYGYQY